MWRLTPIFRSPNEIKALEKFLVNDNLKEHILKEFATGFVSHFEYPTPEPWGSVRNYPHLMTDIGKRKFRAAMRKQVLRGKMIRGTG